MNSGRAGANGDARLRHDLAQAASAWFSGMTLHAGRRGEMAGSLCCEKSGWPTARLGSGMQSAQGEAKHHDSIGAGYTDWGGWRGRLS